MNQEKIGKFIRDIRKKENLSQQKFALKYGVTYQAVSKWENGKNIPDIAILKQMCEEYQMNLDDFLETKIPKKKPTIWIGMGIVFLMIALFLFYPKKGHFEFKTLSSNCNNFKLYGSMAYNDIKSSIYISNITYCGEDDKEKYKVIECILYETDGKVQKEVMRYRSEKENLTLVEFLETVNFNVDNYEKTCKLYQENSFYLEIEAINQEKKMTTYKIPLQLKDNCK
ncbi:MAG: helix-turn-helix transcriptional regulator [Bacilli bacterium]|nr:helix-turn-helix transcriptional regulator [Bacilli bacterium]